MTNSAKFVVFLFQDSLNADKIVKTLSPQNTYKLRYILYIMIIYSNSDKILLQNSQTRGIKKLLDLLGNQNIHRIILCDILWILEVGN